MTDGNVKQYILEYIKENKEEMQIMVSKTEYLSHERTFATLFLLFCLSQVEILRKVVFYKLLFNTGFDLE